LRVDIESGLVLGLCLTKSESLIPGAGSSHKFQSFQLLRTTQFSVMWVGKMVFVAIAEPIHPITPFTDFSA